MKNSRKKLIAVMAVILIVLIVTGIVIGISQAKKQKELEEQGIYYQNGAESVEDWDGLDFSEESDDENALDIENDEEKEDNSTSANSSNDSEKSDSNEKEEDVVKKDNVDSSDSGENNTSSQEDKKKEPVKVPAAGKLTYEQYISMSPEKQEEYFEKFDSEEEFFEWYRDAKAEYDENNKGNVVEGGSIDIGDYMD